MRPSSKPILPTPESRRTELAELLATAILRLHLRSTLTTINPTSQSSLTCLEVSPQTRLSVHDG